MPMLAPIWAVRCPRSKGSPIAAMMRRELERILAAPSLSKGTFEKASKGLA